jgi:two-component system C4-dicarboxylate transport sensor histidine kinase DctB/two-component system sensor histidine kinase TtrS
MRHNIVIVPNPSAHSGEDNGIQDRFSSPSDRNHLADLTTRVMAVGHELRQPFFTIAIAVENLRQMLEIPDVPRDVMRLTLGRVDEQLHRAQQIVSEALDCVGGGAGQSHACDLVDAMSNAISFLEPYFATAGVVVEQRPDPPWAKAPISLIHAEQVFVNVLTNAVESIETRREQGWTGAGRIAIAIGHDGDAVTCFISDNGAGVRASVAQAAFKPFFTTRPGEGTGLGLYICQTLLGASRGTMALRANDGEGAVAEIRLPLVARPT